MCAQRQAETSSATHFLEDPCCSRATSNIGFLKETSSARNILQRLLQGCFYRVSVEAFGAVVPECSPRRGLDLETSCHLLDVGSAFFSAVSFWLLRLRQALRVETPSTDGVPSPRVSVLHAPCLLYLLQHSESCSKPNTADVISMFTSLFPVHVT